MSSRDHSQVWLITGTSPRHTARRPAAGRHADLAGSRVRDRDPAVPPLVAAV